MMQTENLLTISEFTAPNFESFEKNMRQAGPFAFSSESTFNAFCQSAISFWNDYSALRATVDTTQFQPLLEDIENGVNESFATDWGGVRLTTRTPITSPDRPLAENVEKYLVVKGEHYLAFEFHQEKQEKMVGVSGYGIVVYRANPTDANLKVMFMEPGTTIEFAPGVDHCLIALSDLVVQETSLEPKGMDNDLFFKFLPKKRA